jgi:hypothetical protein
MYSFIFMLLDEINTRQKLKYILAIRTEYNECAPAKPWCYQLLLNMQKKLNHFILKLTSSNEWTQKWLQYSWRYEKEATEVKKNIATRQQLIVHATLTKNC